MAGGLHGLAPVRFLGEVLVQAAGAPSSDFFEMGAPLPAFLREVRFGFVGSRFPGFHGKVEYVHQQTPTSSDAAGQPPKGFANWTLRLLAQRVVQLEIVDSASARSQGTAGGGVGLCEIGLVFWPEVQNFEANESGLYGLGLSVVATLLASLGNIASARNKKVGISVMSSNAWTMTYGAGLML